VFGCGCKIWMTLYVFLFLGGGNILRKRKIEKYLV